MYPFIHETIQFIRMVQIIFLKDGSKWGFLHEIKKEARVISRSFFAERMIADRSLLDGIFDCLDNAKYKNPSTYLIFFTMLVMEYI